MNRNTGKHIFWHVRPTKPQISLRICAVWSESSSSAWRNFASWAIQNARSVDSDQTARLRGLIWIFARCTPNGTFSDDVAQLKFHGLLPEIILSVFLVDRLDEIDTFWIDMPFWAYKQDTDFVKTLLKWKIVSNKLHLLTQGMYVITHFRIDASNWRWYGTMIRLITSRNNRSSDKPRTTHSTINTPQTVITLLLGSIA